MKITKLNIPKINYLRIAAYLLIFIMILSIRGSSNTSSPWIVNPNYSSNEDLISTVQFSIINHNKIFRIQLSEISSSNYYTKANFSLFITSVERNKTVLYQEGDFTGDFKCNMKPGNYYIQIDFVNLTKRIELIVSHYGWTVNYTIVFLLTGLSSVALVILEVAKKYFV